MIKEIVVGLDQTTDGPPVFDIEIPTCSGQPAPCRMFFGRVEKPKLLGQPPKLVHCAVFAVNDAEPKHVRRLAILTEGGAIPDELAADAKYLGSYIHPRTFGPISLYEFPWAPLEAEQVDQPVEKLDVMAALENARDAIEASGKEAP